MVNIKLIVEYDGTNYCGWQIQPEGSTIQGELQDALVTILKQRVVVVSAARTDRGVHAKGQVVNFKIPYFFSPFQLTQALNSVLSPDIRVKKAQQMPEEFHARYSANCKIYKYFIYNYRYLPPWLRKFRWWIKFPLDCQEMVNAASHLVGRHDFLSFQNKGSFSSSTIRCVEKIKINKKGPLITVLIKADGFLYKMARNIMGTLVEVGRGKFFPAEIADILSVRDRRKAGPTAPPQGLFLWRVGYPRKLLTASLTKIKG